MNASSSKLRKEKETNIWPILGMTLIRAFLAIGMVISVISSHFRLAGWALLLLVVAGLVLFVVARRSVRKYNIVENRFMANLNAKEEIEKRRTPVASSIRQKMAGYDVHIGAVNVDPDSVLIGKKLRDVPFRSDTGANIIKIQRGTRNITIPSGEEFIFPGDRLIAVGTSEQLEKLRLMVESSVEKAPAEGAGAEFEVVPVTLGPDSYLTGKTLREIGMRDYRCMVVSVLRGEDILTNPKPDFRFAEGDVVWIAGETASCSWIGD